VDLNENFVRPGHRPRNIGEHDFITLEDKCSHVSLPPEGSGCGRDSRRRFRRLVKKLGRYG
jgi:hypothetical protein